MQNDVNKKQLFYEYYHQWIEVYKRGAIREATMAKYLMTLKWVKKLAPDLQVAELTRTTYQKLLNDYAREHERQTTLDFHHQLKGAVLDAVDEGLIERDPTRKAIIKGKSPGAKKIKYLNQFELHTLIAHLDIGEQVNWDCFILLVAKTGMRFSEALAITPADFDFEKQWLASCDEGEKRVLYEAGYRAYASVKIILLAAVVVALLGEVFLGIGLSAVVLLTVCNVISAVIYSYYCRKLEKGRLD